MVKEPSIRTSRNDGYEEGPEDTSREQARQEASCETTAHDVLAFDVLAL